MKEANEVRSGYWKDIFLAGLLVVTLFIGGWRTSEETRPAAYGRRLLPHEPETLQQGSVYYVALTGVDSDPGTETRPWRTIQKAANTLTAGDTVYIKAGTYSERVRPKNSGSAGNFITYAAYPGDSATIDGVNVSMPSYESGLFQVENRSYIRVSGLRITNVGPYDNNAGILVDSSSHIVIENNYTYNTASSGIGVWGSSYITITNNEVELACNDGEQECITVAGTDRFEISNNHVHHGGPGTNGGEGIDAKDGSSNGAIYGNSVHHMSSDRTGIYIDAWDKHTFNINVYRNTICDCSSGITLASEAGGLLENIRITNNIAYHNKVNGLEIGDWGESGISEHPVENAVFINNTIYDNGYDGWGGGFHVENPDASGIVVRNNIFSQNLSFQIADESSLSSADLTVDHNLIHGYRGYDGETYGSDYVEADPRFVDAPGADFHLQASSAAIDAGSSTGAPTDDFAGSQRPQDGDEDGTPATDIGAYEMTAYSDWVYLPVVLR